MDKEAVILGNAQARGFKRKRFQELTGIPPATFYRRMKNPDDITLGELRRMDELAHFPDEVIIKLIRNK